MADPRKRDAAFSTLEHLILHAHHAGVTICVENTTSEMGDPSYLRAFVDETRLTGLRFNFDIGHAHLAELPEEERLERVSRPCAISSPLFTSTTITATRTSISLPTKAPSTGPPPSKSSSLRRKLVCRLSWN